jgi:hypothetical protein
VAVGWRALHEVDARGDGTPDALALCMEGEPEPSRAREQSQRLIDAARQAKQRAVEHIQTSQQRLDQARNTLQASWLVRALRERLRRRDA